MNKHQIVADTRYTPTGGGDKDSHVVTGFHCTHCQVRGQTRDEINQQPCHSEVKE